MNVFQHLMSSQHLYLKKSSHPSHSLGFTLPLCNSKYWRFRSLKKLVCKRQVKETSNFCLPPFPPSIPVLLKIRINFVRCQSFFFFLVCMCHAESRFTLLKRRLESERERVSRICSVHHDVIFCLCRIHQCQLMLLVVYHWYFHLEISDAETLRSSQIKWRLMEKASKKNFRTLSTSLLCLRFQLVK